MIQRVVGQRALLVFSLVSCILSRETQIPTECEFPETRSHILSTNPLVIYLPAFLTEREIAHLLNASSHSFKPSQVSQRGQGPKLDQSLRSSMSAPLSLDNTAACVLARAGALQGFKPMAQFEPLQVVKYAPLDQYKFHYDWQIQTYDELSTGQNRDVSIFVYLEADCIGGGTQFPRLKRPKGRKWCHWIDCPEVEDDSKTTTGVTFKPITGNAILWLNLHLNGTGNPDMLHAGLAVTKGSKVGLNIWSLLNLGCREADEDVM